MTPKITERAAVAAAGAIDRGTSRRGFLARAALVGTAFAVAPLRYLLRPVSAWAVIAPSNCGANSRCNDGYTEFCCSITGGANTCPSGTYVGGWWKCSHYGGSRLCGNQGVRYYLDCNLKPGEGYPGGCQCAHGSCNERRVACNVFRYGQCNTAVAGTTAIVCRVVTCTNPATVPAYNCNPTLMFDEHTCGHEAGCLDYGHAGVIGANPAA